MSDNEKRAHDLAVAVAASLSKLRLEEARLKGEHLGLDIYEIYQNHYIGYLNEFNHNFPEGQK